ncbi:DnaD domain-containing protein [Clostridium brassicae]|uniref:DnaD domain protein n=1 Tax=Clostridium brassicae TaxID=2999072 RepID=A0ABT4D818_9CLOT|nr:DnaD domain protein [Clostridium brassicae]MCY6958415.1 DnaD domain protein [Clostridium brassicae]
MAKYRQIYTEFWNDGFILDLTPEEKYFYLYLMTNQKTSQCGVFELPKRIIETETGYNRDTVDKLLKRFTEHGKIQYCNETKEIMILNWVKYNQPNNTNAIKCVNKELKNIKNKRFINAFYLQCKKQNLDVVSIFEGTEDEANKVDAEYYEECQVDDGEFEDICDEDYESEENQQVEDLKGSFERGLVGACKGLPSNKVISNKEEIISNKQKIKNKKHKIKNNKQKVKSNSNKSNKEKQRCDYEIENKEHEEAKYSEAKHSDCEETKDTTITATSTAASKAEFKDIISVFENNIHPMVPMEYEKIIDWSSKFSCDVIIMAIEEAVSNNVRNMRYIERILHAWLSNGITTIEEIKSCKREWENRKKFNSKNSFVDQWNYSGQRNYDYDELEKKLLGLDSTEDEECG